MLYHYLVSQNYTYNPNSPDPKPKTCTQNSANTSLAWTEHDPSQNLLQNRNTLQHSRQRHRNGVILDSVLGVPGRAGPEDDIDDGGHGLVKRVV